MGRLLPVSWEEIPDIEDLDADGRWARITLYPHGKITVDDLRTASIEEDERE